MTLNAYYKWIKTPPESFYGLISFRETHLNLTWPLRKTFIELNCTSAEIATEWALFEQEPWWLVAEVRFDCPGPQAKRGCRHRSQKTWAGFASKTNPKWSLFFSVLGLCHMIIWNPPWNEMHNVQNLKNRFYFLSAWPVSHHLKKTFST